MAGFVSYRFRVAWLLAFALYPLAGSAATIPYFFTGSGTVSLDGGPAVSGLLTLIGVGDPIAGGGGSPTLGVIARTIPLAALRLRALGIDTQAQYPGSIQELIQSRFYFP